MHSNDQEVLAQALRWHQAGHRTVLATVLSTFGASPRPPGSMAVISEQGLISGSVSGGCVEDDLVREVMSGAFWDAAEATDTRVALRTYGRDAPERERYRLPCGNALKLAVEPFWSAETMYEALRHIQQRRLVMRELHYATGLVRLGMAPAHAGFADDAQGLRQVLGPSHRLLVIGATEVSRYLLPVAQSLGYAVSICDPRSEYTGAWPVELPVPLITDMPDDAVMAFDCDARTAVVTVTHDPKLDDLALMEALKSPAFYVGALGSGMTTAQRKARLLQFDLDQRQVDALRGPVGLPIGSRSPAEIAVSIAAELIQVRRLLDTGADPFEARCVRPAWQAGEQAAGTTCNLVAT
jgi:xanthine dehydrogenase accessory factor